MLPFLSGGPGKLLKFIVIGVLVVTLGSIILGLLFKLAVLALVGYVALRILKSQIKTENPSEAEPVSTVPPKSICTEAPAQEVRLGEWLSERARIMGRFVIEVVAGTLAGALLGLIASWDAPERTSPIAIGALIGAALGVFAGFRSMASAAEEEEPAPQPDGTS